MRPLFFALLLCLASASAAWALSADAMLTDAAQEARARALFLQIRCVVCQSESIADSPADVASDMRRVIREQIATGKSDADIRDYLTGQYGDAILMQPPLKSSTALLWFGPLLILCAGLALAWRAFRKPARAGS